MDLFEWSNCIQLPETWGASDCQRRCQAHRLGWRLSKSPPSRAQGSDVCVFRDLGDMCTIWCFFSVQADRTVTCQLFIIPCLCVCIQSLHCSMMTSDHRFRSVSTSTTVLQTLWSAIFDRWSNKSWNSRSFHSLSPLVKLDVKQKESSLKTGCIWFELWQARILQSSLHFAYLLWSQRWQPLPWRRRGQSKGIKMN